MIELSGEQQVRLLGLARRTIRNVLDGKGLPEIDMVDDFSDRIFAEKCGAFVTLHAGRALRGCIGYIKGIKTIPETIIDMANASAFKDPRFPPLGKREYDIIDIEISIMSPIEEVRDVSEIVIGRDGLIISAGYRTGLLLPQVATECGWDGNTFLEHTCYKAGLPGDAWRAKGTKIEKFSAQVFGEKAHGLK
ncbi:MAG TPA: AmmeMemoRadiSam system protein A [Spirochaetota bacterium]|nr:AmmeMemoRadiSam system protein A [Spirochaetota bacterium]